MLTLLGILAALVVLFVAASVATRDGDVLLEAPRDAADLDLPGEPLQPEDLPAVRFGMAVRGYRMSEVDAVLDRFRSELSSRDVRIRELEGAQQPLYSAIDPTVAPVVEPPAYDEPPSPRQEVPADDAAFSGPVAVPVPTAAHDRPPDEPTDDHPHPV